MMQKIQKFGGAMFTPVLLFAFAGISVGIGTLFTTQAIMGGLAAPTSMWYKCWNVFLQGGWTVFNQLPLLFAVSFANRNGKETKCKMLHGSISFIYDVPLFCKHDLNSVGWSIRS